MNPTGLRTPICGFVSVGEVGDAFPMPGTNCRLRFGEVMTRRAEPLESLESWNCHLRLKETTRIDWSLITQLTGLGRKERGRSENLKNLRAWHSHSLTAYGDA
jgi:hypothetical protein